MSDTAAKQFLEIFNKIEHELHDRYGATRYMGFKRLVETLSQENSLIREYAVDLIEYLQLRNAIVHKTTGEPIAQPHSSVITGITELYQRLVNPPVALEIASRPVFTCSTTDNLERVIAQMKRYFSSVVPVYHDGRFVAVLSEHSFLLWLDSIVTQQSAHTIDLTTYTVADLQPFYGHADDKRSGYRFITPETDIYTIRDFFLSFSSDKKRLGAVFITQSGDAFTEIKGIITAWDMWKVKDITQKKDVAQEHVTTV